MRILSIYKFVQEMKEIKKASAGSGKTFTLAKTYIEILLDKYVNNKKDREGYQHILAVTFTNKATAEMKDRIITELYILATHPEKSDFIEDFKVKYGSIKGIQTACSEILKTLLHDYSRFSVSTIDTFFQVVLRSFARELGQFNAYRIELDREGVVNETVDAILEELTDEKDAIVKVLTDMVARQLDEGRKADPVSALRGYALSIKEGAFLRAL